MDPTFSKGSQPSSEFAELTERMDELKEKLIVLQKENNYLRELYDRVPLGYQSLDENGHLIEVNQAWLDALGYDRQDVIGRNVAEFLHPDWREHFRTNFPRFKAVGEIMGVEFEMLKKDGSFVHVSFTGKIGRDSQNRFQQTYCIFQDITRQKQVERDLLFSENKWRNILVSIPQICISLDKTGKIIFANAHFLKLVGWAEHEVIGRDWFDLFVPDQIRERLRQVFFAMARRKNPRRLPNNENDIVTRAGELRSIAWSNVLSYDSHGNIGDITCLGVDLTERKQAEEALRKSEAHYHSLFANSLVGVSVSNKDLVITDANDAFLSMLEYTKEEFIGRKTVSDISHPGDVKRSLEMIDKLMRGEIEYFSLEKNYISKTGKTIPAMIYVKGLYNTHGDFEGVAASILEMTARKKTEELLIENEEKYRNLFNNSEIAMFRSRLDGSETLEVNEKFLEIIGKTREETQGRPSAILWADPKEREEMVRRLIADGRVTDFEFKMLNEKKGLRYCLTSLRLYQERGILEGSVADITERKLAEQERAKMQEQLNQAQKLKAIGQLAGGVAHDFNNMLGVIQGHTELAMEEIDASHPVFADLREISNAAGRSVDITRQLLAFARKQTIVPRVVELNETVEGMLKMLRRLIGEGIELIWRPGFSLWPVNIDPSQVDQVLANLCVNARDATSGVGTIVVETRNSVIEEDYCQNNTEAVPGDYVLLVVSDNGAGIPEEIQAHIFEPFYTTKGVGEGTGLGLATVYGIVRQNNGFITVYSEPERGTTFRIHLPRHIGKQGESEREKTSQLVEAGSETVLLVEDEPAIMRMTSLMLQRLGYRVLAVQSPNEAIQLVEEIGHTIHLLITDVIMPGMNGRELAARLRTLQPEMKFLFMSGYTADIITNQAVLEEGVCFIQKPFSKKELAASIRTALH